MKIAIALILLGGCLGCSQVNHVVNRHNKTWELAKTHPAVSRMCAVAGGCENIDFECKIWDGTGNTTLRNTTMVKFTYRGTSYEWGVSFEDNYKANISEMIDKAAENFIDWWNRGKARQPEETLVYPNSHTCDDKDCQ